jgi:hypothetical protein
VAKRGATELIQRNETKKGRMMRSGLANVMMSIGAIFFGFGLSFIIIGMLGVRFGGRPELGTAGTLGFVGLVGGAVLAGGAIAMGRKL